MSKQFIFPEKERDRGAVWALLVVEVLLHASLILCSVRFRNYVGICVSLCFAAFLAFVHVSNLRMRKYCLAQWSFDGDMFHAYIGQEVRSVDVSGSFCVSVVNLSFGRRYGTVLYPFYLVWIPGKAAPHEAMNAYLALKMRDAMILPVNDQTCRLFADSLGVKNIPRWPRSGVYKGTASATVNMEPFYE